MPPARRVPEATVARLPIYLRALSEVAIERTGTISSEHLASRAGVNAAQLRKDLSHLGSYGTRGVGYDVAFLVRQINRQLGLAEQRRVAIVGVGNLGRALARYDGFATRGFRVVATFDADPAKVGTPVGGVSVSPVGTMAEVLRAEQVEIAVIATPAGAAQEVAEALVAAGVRSLLNFAPTTLSVPPHVALRQVDLGIELQILSFYEREAAGAGTGG
ncbi:MAG: redox-sensing transcriptional repressor Rex [Acidimicrobiales bacterium]